MVLHVMVNIVNTFDDLAMITSTSTMTTETIFELARVYPKLDHNLLELSVHILGTVTKRIIVTEHILSRCIMVASKGFEVEGRIDILKHCITIVKNLCSNFY